MVLTRGRLSNQSSLLTHYQDDPEESKWKINDFLGHCTGLATRGIREINTGSSGDVVNLRAECIKNLINQTV